MNPGQIDLSDPRTDSLRALEWVDRSRAEHERYLEHLENAIALCDGRARKDPGAKWARPQVQAEAAAVRKRLAQADSAQPALEKAREVLRAAIATWVETRRAIEAATDVDELLRARGQLELDGRAAVAARLAFNAAAAASRMPLIQQYDLWRGSRLHFASSDLADLAGLGEALAGYDPYGPNDARAESARTQVYARRETDPAEMAISVAFEGVYRDDPDAAYVFDQRWTIWAQRNQPAAAE